MPTQELFGQFGYGLLPQQPNKATYRNLPTQQPAPQFNGQTRTQIPLTPNALAPQRENSANTAAARSYGAAQYSRSQQPGQQQRSPQGQAFAEQFMAAQSTIAQPFNPSPNPQAILEKTGAVPNGPQPYVDSQSLAAQIQPNQLIQSTPPSDLYPKQPADDSQWPDQNYQRPLQIPPSLEQPPMDQQPFPLQQPNLIVSPPQAAPAQTPVQQLESSGTAAQLASSNNANRLNAVVPTEPNAHPENPVKEEPEEQVFEGGKLLAVVGEEPILLGDLLPLVDAKMTELEGKIPPAQKEIVRQQIVRRALQDHVITKCLAQKFVRDTVGVKPQKEYADFRKSIGPRTTKVFYTQYIPTLMKRQKVETEKELDEKMRTMGTSIAAQHAAFADSVLADEVIRAHVPKNPRIDLQDIRDYYAEHLSDYQMPAKAKWRQLSVQFSNHDTKEDAAKKISDMGNEILFGGTNFEAVAKKMSEGPMASKGGAFDWTTQGALKSKVLDENLFKLPLNRLSRIIEDETGYHIIEVTERQDARTVSFAEAQLDIRKDLEEKKQTTLRKEFVDKVRKETPIWSLWPQDIPDARPLSELASGTGAKTNPN